jgi:hypothetical protein
MLGGNEQSGGSHVGRVTPGFELIDEQPPHGQEGELVCGELLQAVIGTDENEAFNRADARETNGDAAAVMRSKSVTVLIAPKSNKNSCCL